MLVNTRGIVLKSFKYSEKSIVVKIYTESFGIQTYFIAGARGAKSKNKASLFHPLSSLDMVVYHKQKEGLKKIKECKQDILSGSIRHDITKGTVAMFLAEIIYLTIKEEESNPPLFQFLHSTVQYMENSEPLSPAFHLFFMVRLTKFLGFLPINNYTPENPFFDTREGEFTHRKTVNSCSQESSLQLHLFLGMNFADLVKFQISKQESRDLLDVLIGYYRYHIQGMPEIKSIKVLREIAE